ncbi:MAG: hypothetical protein U0903_21820 [Planctomycetales bacterium]
MRHLLLAVVTLSALSGTLYLSARNSVPSVAKVDKIDAKNPWTSLEFNNNPATSSSRSSPTGPAATATRSSKKPSAS